MEETYSPPARPSQMLCSIGEEQGGRPVRIPSPPPPPPSRSPKVFEPFFLQLEILGKGSAPKAPKISLAVLEGVIIYFSPYVSIL